MDNSNCESQVLPPKFIQYSGNLTYQPKSERNFNEIYESVISESYVGAAELPHPIILDQAEPKIQTCAICNLKEGETTFKEEAHAIPAFLANRIFFTSEECDTCNSKYGRESDDHLARMTEPMRVLYQMPTRGSPPRSSIKGDTTQFSLDENGITVSFGGPGSHTSVQFDQEAQELHLALPAKDYEPVAALRSILRTFWFFMNPKLRRKFKYILEIATGKSSLQLFNFCIGSLPDRHPHEVTITMWVKMNHNPGLPDVICEMTVGKQWFVIPLPQAGESEFIKFPLPPKRGREDSQPPSLTSHLVRSGNVAIPKIQKISFTFESVKKGSSIPRKTRQIVRQRRGQLPVTVESKSGTKIQKLEPCYLRVKNLNSSARVMEIISPLGITMRYLDKKGAYSDFSFALSPQRMPVGDVLKCVNLVEIMHESGSSMELRGPLGQSLRMFTKLEDSQKPITFNKDLAQRLLDISNFLGRELLYPAQEPSTKDLEQLSICHNVISELVDDSIKGTVSFALKNPEGISKLTSSENTVTLFADSKLLHLCGNSIRFPSYRIELSSCVFESTDQNTRRSEFKYTGVAFKLNSI